MNKDAIGLIMVMTLLSDMMASLFVAIRLRALRNGSQTALVNTLALVFFGIFLRGFCHIVAECFGYTVRPHYTGGYIIAYWTGRACLTIPCWIMAVRLIGGRGLLSHK